MNSEELDQYVHIEPGITPGRPRSVERLTVRLPEELLDALDEVVEQGVYEYRSEAIRDGIITAIQEADR